MLVKFQFYNLSDHSFFIHRFSFSVRVFEFKQNGFIFYQYLKIWRWTGWNLIWGRVRFIQISSTKLQFKSGMKAGLLKISNKVNELTTQAE